MRRALFVSLVLLLAALPAAADKAKPRIISFPCSKNLADGRVLVDGPSWDQKMRDLGYVLADGAYVPWKVLGFTLQKKQDDIWADGICRMRLLPVAK